MTECFPPVPLYIVTAIVVTMFTAVTAKIEDASSETDRRDSGSQLSC